MDSNTVSTEQTEITISNKSRVLYFSDGAEEFEEETEDHPSPDDIDNSLINDPANVVDPTTLDWVPWLSHYAWKSGTTMLNAVDYAGESLAYFFRITTPKYQLEIDEYERMQEERKIIEDESIGWVSKDIGGNVPLVLCEPAKEPKEAV